jgi:four helix bundle protein
LDSLYESAKNRQSLAVCGRNRAGGIWRSKKHRVVDAKFARYLDIARKSSSELERELLLARDLCYFEEDTYAKLAGALIEIWYMLNAFAQRLTANR